VRVHDFLRRLVEATRHRLPPEWQDFHHRIRFSLAQLYYTDPRIHFEVWVQGKKNRVEIGLHLEADKVTNDRLLSHLASRFIEIQAELGPQIELEQWTRTWGRVHQTVPYTRLDEELVQAVADRLAPMIVLLAPMLEEREHGEEPGLGG
jgi:hypothetical protein